MPSLSQMEAILAQRQADAIAKLAGGCVGLVIKLGRDGLLIAASLKILGFI